MTLSKVSNAGPLAKSSGERMTRARAREVLEQARMDVAELMAQSLTTQQKLHGQVRVLDEVWETLLGEPAPELAIPWEAAS